MAMKEAFCSSWPYEDDHETCSMCHELVDYIYMSDFDEKPYCEKCISKLPLPPVGQPILWDAKSYNIPYARSGDKYTCMLNTNKCDMATGRYYGGEFYTAFVQVAYPVIGFPGKYLCKRCYREWWIKNGIQREQGGYWSDTDADYPDDD